MPFRIEIFSIVPDIRAAIRRSHCDELGYSHGINDLMIIDVYTIDKDLAAQQINIITDRLVNPVTQQVKNHQDSFDWAIETGSLPGVTDNVGTTAKEIIEDALQIKFEEEEAVYYSQLHFISGTLTASDTHTIAFSLINPLIQRVHIKSHNEYIRDNGMDTIVPRVILSQKQQVSTVNLEIPDEELIIIGKKGIANPDGTTRGPLALDLTYMKAIQEYFKQKGRAPTDVELESIAQTWSEHCKHTIFADPIDDIKDGLYKTYIKAATQEIRRKKGDKDICVSVFTDNAGAIKFDENYLVTDKVETHNSPSALDPFGGAITGIGGVNRDAIGFGLGAKPIANRYGFCFADPAMQTVLYKDQKLTQKMLSPKRINEGVIAGVNSGGNCSGIPTTQGFVYYDKRYQGKPLVFVGTLGLIPKKNNEQVLHQKSAYPGDFIVMIGGRVGLDGIHGATFSSEALDTGSPATAVQIGDPITQKKLSDVLVKEARDKQLYTSITDNGAGGLSCSVPEMAKECGGCYVQLNKVPVKYHGIDPWQIWISESQERMTLSVPKQKWKELHDLLNSRDVEATVIGEFTDTGKCLVEFNGDIVMDLEMEFLHNGLPPRQMNTRYTPPTNEEPIIPISENLNKPFEALLERLNISSFEYISTQYDHEVQGGSALKPLQGKGRINADATAIKPVLESSKSVIMAHGLAPSYSDIDTYEMAACSIDTAIRNAIAAGAKLDNLAMLDNFCWCSSNDPQRLGELKRAAKACYDYALAYEIPFISGKDSMFNDFKGFDEAGNAITISIPPTLLISTVGVIDDTTKLVSLDVKMPGDLVYVLGDTYDELGGSEYYAYWSDLENHRYVGEKAPSVYAPKNKELYEKVSQCIDNNLIASSISITRGGLAVALAKTSLGGQLGLDVSIQNLPGKATRDDFSLFSESQGRIIVTINPENKEQFEKIMSRSSFAQIGEVTAEKIIRIKGLKGKSIIEVNSNTALNAYRSNSKKQNASSFKPKTLILSGYGLNCEEETKFAFEKAGGDADIIHINSLIQNSNLLNDYQILAIPGGFSYGDDTGSGNAFANRIKNHLWENIRKYIEKDHLVIGICNGFQILVNLGLLPALDKNYGNRDVALLHNNSGKYIDRWVDLKITNQTPWLLDITNLSLPIAHGEGKFYASPEILQRIKSRELIATQYTSGEICEIQNLPANPNGALEDIAALTDETGRILGIMPHPERAISFTQLPHWTYLKELYRREGKEIPEKGPGLKIFQNAVQYFH
ncbi:MAG: phosphoribosylformylglycinamidine synthase subunit PurQ [bacterium]|nr:phosphoribosylformylglycinamidine synthase subunit PurQ [bacterium]